MLTLCFAILAARQLWIQTIAAPALNASPYNVRARLDAHDRGRILARDGKTILARSVNDARVYPLGPQLAQTVGYLSTRYGESGLESAYDTLLDAPIGAENLIDRLRELVDRHSHHPPRNGGTLVTTIDPALQGLLYTELARYRHAAGVVLDVQSGDVLAVASVPSFDPEHLDRDFATISHDPESVLLNRALNGLYPPGSTFKIVTAATALQDGVATADSTYSDPGYLDVGNAVIHDDQGEATGRQTLTGAFALSSNVDFGGIGLTLGVSRFYAGMSKFGVGSPLRSELPISMDRVPSQASVSDSILAQLAFGQADLLVTPMRMALVGAAVADGGSAPAPHFVRSMVSPANIETHPAPLPGVTAMTPTVAATLSAMMRAVVTRGTGTAADSALVTIAGKTGTATNPAGAPHAWFVGFAPVEHPKVVVAVIVENGGYGGGVAAPIARDLLVHAVVPTGSISR